MGAPSQAIRVSSSAPSARRLESFLPYGLMCGACGGVWVWTWSILVSYDGNFDQFSVCELCLVLVEAPRIVVWVAIGVAEVQNAVEVGINHPLRVFEHFCLVHHQTTFRCDDVCFQKAAEVLRLRARRFAAIG